MAKSRALLLLLALAVPTLWLGWHQTRLRVDVENLAMKSVGTPEATAMQERLAEFGAEHTVLLCYEGVASAPAIEDSDEPKGLVAALRKVPGVTQVRRVPQRGDTAFLYAVDLVASADGSYADRVRAVLAEAERHTPPVLHLRATGQPVGEIAIAEAVAAERRTMLPLIAGVLGLLLLITYRSVVLVGAILVPTVAAIAWTGGTLDLLGVRLDPVSSLQDPVLLTVGVASAVHLIEAFLRRRSSGADVASATVLGARELVAPTLLTAGTTVAGFASLWLSAIPAVQSFGVTTAAGVVVACLLTFVVGPAWLVAFAGSERIAGLRPPAGPTLDLARGLAVFVRARRTGILLTFTFCTCVGAWSWTRLTIDTDPIRVLPAKHPFRVATSAVEHRLGGIETFDLLLPKEAKPPGFLALARLQAKIATEPGVALLAGAPRTAPSGSILLRVLLAPAGTTAREALFHRCEHLARELGYTHAVATGPSVQVARDSGRLARGQGTGLVVTVALLFLMMVVGFRSWWLGFLGLLPNVLPSVAIYGGLAALGRPLSVASAMIGSIMLGLTVDNTIHLVHRFRNGTQRGTSRIAALARALHESGRGVLNGSIVLALGFGAGVFGRLETTREFGLLAALAIGVALVADLMLMPALLARRGNAPRKTLLPKTATHATLPC